MSKARALAKRVWLPRCGHFKKKKDASKLCQETVDNSTADVCNWTTAKKKDASELCQETVDDRSAEHTSWTIVLMTMVAIVACLWVLVFQIIRWVNTIVDVYNKNFQVIGNNFDVIAQDLDVYNSNFKIMSDDLRTFAHVNVSMSQKSLLEEFGNTERNELNVL